LNPEDLTIWMTTHQHPVNGGRYLFQLLPPICIAAFNILNKLIEVFQVDFGDAVVL
jgi:hypothetical protein